MALTGQEKYLIETLKDYEMSVDDTIGILAILKTVQQRDEFLDWIVQNHTATEREIMNKVGEIVKNSH
ncbi:MAG: hypothetical protein SPI76_04020 [Candidatus Fimenecus sp.]|nr:hypothetical protein [Candidatus Fimenecus sp.]